MADDEYDDPLKDCLATVQHLEEENRHLRNAAASFGQLAERLNEALDRERRVATGDRRHESRPSQDRRGQPHHR
jgi:predicted RNase H-like nuclease (RuvC/YqgF family)